MQPSQRVREFPNHSLKEQLRKLFCACCKTELSKIKGSVNTHVLTTMHLKNLEKWRASLDDDSFISHNLVEYYKANPDEKYGTLSPEVMLFRYRAVEAALYAGIDIAKLDYIRPLLLRSGVSMTDSSDLRTYIPKIEAAELEKMRREMAGAIFSNAFDGTRRYGEVLAMVSLPQAAGVSRPCGAVYVPWPCRLNTTPKHVHCRAVLSLKLYAIFRAFFSGFARFQEK